MNCVCYNIINRLQTELGNIISTLANNRINSGTPSTDDEAYQPNLHLLDQDTPSSFDINTFFYICMTLLAIATLSSLMGSRRRRRIIGNTSSLN